MMTDPDPDRLVMGERYSLLNGKLTVLHRAMKAAVEYRPGETVTFGELRAHIDATLAGKPGRMG